MNTLIKADIFFFITSVAVIVLSIGLVIALFYIIRILRNVEDISETVKDESQAVAGDISQLRSTIKSGKLITGLFSFFKRIFGRLTARASKRQGRKNH